MVQENCQNVNLLKNVISSLCLIYSFFTTLGFYTGMLIPAAIMGFIVIFYGLVSMNSYQPM